VIFALLGSGIHLDPILRISTGIVLFLVSGMLGVTLFRRYRTSLALDPGGGASRGGSHRPSCLRRFGPDR
jgi:hypothetical protein